MNEQNAVATKDDVADMLNGMLPQIRAIAPKWFSAERITRAARKVRRLVRPSRFAFRDRYGWPVERIIGRPITNIIRLILHTDIVQSCRRPNNSMRVSE